MEARGLSASEAAQALRAAGLRAPLECDTAERIAQHGECFALDFGRGAGVCVLRRDGNVLWVDAAAATRGDGLTEDGLQFVQAIARRIGARKIAFETNRRGLVRKARKAGCRVVGFVMEKDVQ